MTRVVFLSSEYPPHIYGGLGTAVEALSRYLAATGVEVVLVVPNAPGYAQPPPGVRLHPVPVNGASSDVDYWLIYCQAVLDAARRGELRADVVHCHDWMTVLGGLAIGRVLGVPVLMSVHLPQSDGMHIALENLGLAGCDSVLVNSYAVRAELTARETSCAEIAVIPNGVDLHRFYPTETPPSSCQILFAGRLVPSKGVDVVMRAFGAVLRRVPQARLIIAGDGDQRLYLERLARFLGLRQYVSFLGWQSPDELAALYRASAVISVPSLYEPFGLVALEAMACGRPVVVSRVGGLAEIIEDGVSGYAVAVGDHLDLATRLATVLSDGTFAEETGRAARRRAESFDWATIADRTARLYRSLATRPTPESVSVQRLLSTADTELRTRLLAILTPVLAADGGNYGR
jgi:1,4-alpha-glucan branching enzyme